MARQHQRRERAKINIDKEMVVHGEGFENSTTAAYVTADPVSTKTVRRELHKSNIHGGAAIAKSLITESNAQMRERWCHDHKTWTSDNCKRARDMVT
jgi:hypothetical protein